MYIRIDLVGSRLEHHWVSLDLMLYIIYMQFLYMLKGFEEALLSICAYEI